MPMTVMAKPVVAPIVDKAEAALRSGVLLPEPPKAGATEVDSGLDLVAEGELDGDADLVAFPLNGLEAPHG